MSNTTQVWLLVEQEGSLLLALRKAGEKPFGGRWTLPGGAKGGDESPGVAVARYGREQLDINIMGEELIDTLTLVEVGDIHEVMVFRVGYEGKPRFRESGPFAQVLWARAADLADDSVALPEPLRLTLTAATGGDAG